MNRAEYRLTFHSEITVNSQTCKNIITRTIHTHSSTHTRASTKYCTSRRPHTKWWRSRPRQRTDTALRVISIQTNSYHLHCHVTVINHKWTNVKPALSRHWNETDNVNLAILWNSLLWNSQTVRKHWSTKSNYNWKHSCNETTELDSPDRRQDGHTTIF